MRNRCNSVGVKHSKQHLPHIHTAHPRGGQLTWNTSCGIQYHVGGCTHKHRCLARNPNTAPPQTARSFIFKGLQALKRRTHYRVLHSQTLYKACSVSSSAEYMRTGGKHFISHRYRSTLQSSSPGHRLVSVRRSALPVPCSPHSRSSTCINRFSQDQHTLSICRLSTKIWKTSLQLRVRNRHTNKESTLLPVVDSEPLQRQTHAV